MVPLPGPGGHVVQRFAALLDGLLLTPSRNGKLALIARYLRETPDPDRGWALAALTSAVDFPAVKAGTVRGLMAERVDPVLCALSRDFVGDTAETASLLWPEHDSLAQEPALTLGEIVPALGNTTRTAAPALLASLLDRLDTAGRYALIKFATGALRIGISARLAKVAFAQAFLVPVDEVEEYWHGQAPPYSPLFQWATGAAPPPRTDLLPLFRPFMLAHPLEDQAISLTDYVAEWKWDGIRVQLVHVNGETRVYSRGGDEISASFPEIAAALPFPAVLDGELLAWDAGTAGGLPAPFQRLQQRIQRKTLSRKLLAEVPVRFIAYDLLEAAGQDLRGQPQARRRQQLQGLLAGQALAISPLVDAPDWPALASLRAESRARGVEGLMLKHRASAYGSGRTKADGLWWKWKIAPHTVDAVLVYAQAGHGRRAGLYTDYSFAVWSRPPADAAEADAVVQAIAARQLEQGAQLLLGMARRSHGGIEGGKSFGSAGWRGCRGHSGSWGFEG